MPFTEADPLPALLADGSTRLTWQDGIVDTIGFALAPDPDDRRAALVRALATDPEDVADPQRWESVLIEAVLARPETDPVRELDIRLTDYHHSAARAAAALAGRQRPRLERLRFGFDQTEMLAFTATTSTGREMGDEIFAADFSFPFVQPPTVDRLCAALPALRSLRLEGSELMAGLRHDGLTELTLRASPFSHLLAGGRPEQTRLPQLRTLTLCSEGDAAGGAVNAIDLRLTPDALPRLERLDLRGSFFDVDMPAGGYPDFPPDGDPDAADYQGVTIFMAMAHSLILPQLRWLGLPIIDTGEHGWDRPDRLAALAPRFAHLDQLAVAKVTDDEAAVHDLLPNLVITA